MPWHVTKGGGCSSSKPFAVVKESTGETVSCHVTKEKASAAVRALYASETMSSLAAVPYTGDGGMVALFPAVDEAGVIWDTPSMKKLTLIEQADNLLIETVLTKENCLITSRTPSHKYAEAKVGGRQIMAHQVVWVRFYGQIPEGLVLHHRCGVPRCLNVTHMELKTRPEHGLIHAPYQNMCSTHLRLYDYRNKKTGWGVCLACGREAQRRYRERKRLKS